MLLCRDTALPYGSGCQAVYCPGRSLKLLESDSKHA